MKTSGFYYSLMTVLLRAALLVALVGGGWIIYSQLPQSSKEDEPAARGETMLQIVLRPSAGSQPEALDIPVELYPIDIVAARHEYFTERRAGKRFDDFLSERMKGRSPIAAKLDKDGQTFVSVHPGSWWLHALLSGDEELEWRLPITVAGRKQTVELTSQNVYTRTRSF
jgi:hypothetical protein